MSSKLDLLDLPDILDLPDKLIPLIDKFNDYRFFKIDGGRVGAKSQSVGRFLLALGEMNFVRICCGREIQVNINESVYALLVDLIVSYNLNWNVKSKVLEHRETGSTFIFKGFREQGKLNIKGLEGIDILWIDEAQAITKPTLQVIIPTVRKQNSKLIFTMNRTLEDDAVQVEFEPRKDCLSISINYYDNPHCPHESKVEAQNMKTTDIDSYNHIWLGQPLLNASNFVFPARLLEHAKQRHDILALSRIKNNIGVAVDPSGMGSDDNVFMAGNDGLPLEIFKKTIMSPGEKALKAVEMCKRLNGWWIVVDCDGIGADTFLELQSFDQTFLCGIQLIKFHGSAPSAISMTTSLKNNKPIYQNMRAEAAFVAQKRAYAGLAALDPRDTSTTEELRKDIAFVNRQGLLQLIDKKDIKEQLKRSPGGADCWKMLQWTMDKDIKDETFRQRQEQPQQYADTSSDMQQTQSYRDHQQYSQTD